MFIARCLKQETREYSLMYRRTEGETIDPLLYLGSLESGVLRRHAIAARFLAAHNTRFHPSRDGGGFVAF